jgi:hypothetical protein
MLNTRSKHGVLIACALSLAIVALLAHYFLQAQEEHDRKNAATRKADQIDVITTAFLRKISRESQEIPEPEIIAVCIAEERQDAGLVDPRNEILDRLKPMIAKIASYSYCKSLPPEKAYVLYWLSEFNQISDYEATATIGYTPFLRGIYNDGETFHLIKHDGKWEIDSVGAAWIT